MSCLIPRRRRQAFWGVEHDEPGDLPPAEGVPHQADWVGHRLFNWRVEANPHVCVQDPSVQLEELRRNSLIGPSDLKLPEETWLGAYERQCHLFTELHKSIISNMNALSECKDARDSVNRARRRLNDHDGGVPGLNSDDEDDRHFSPHPNDGIGAEDAMTDLLPENEERELLRTLDSLITLPSRVALDQRYAREECLDNAQSFGSASLVQENERRALETERAAMRILKRKRTSTQSDDSGRRVRQRNTRLPAVEVYNLPREAHGESSTIAGHALSDSLPNVVGQIIEDLGLAANEEQRRAFEIVARHVCHGGRQLLMYVGGVGGTGKSHVVNAILTLFERLGRQSEIKVAAPTGAAAAVVVWRQ